MIFNKKKLFSDFLYYSKAINIFKKYYSHDYLIILNYHRIRLKDQLYSNPFLDYSYFTDVEQFSRQISWLKNNAKIISQSDLISVLNRGGKPDYERPCVMITFDDGYRDNYDLAYPILKKHNVPAVFFITSNMVENGELPWWDIIVYMLKKTRKLSFRYEDHSFNLATDKFRAMVFFQEVMKTYPAPRTRHLLGEISEILEVQLPPSELQREHIMTWDQVREMNQNGMDIGSHTHTHRVFSTISEMEIREELMFSKLMIENAINSPVLSVSYPVGEPQLISRETELLSMESGYTLGFTTNSGVNSWEGINRYLIKRTASLLEDISTVSLMTLFPDIFFREKETSEKLKPSVPSFADSIYQQGLFCLSQNKLEKARWSFEKALLINPSYLDARIKMGLCCLLSARTQEAAEHFKKILEDYPNFPDIHYFLGIAYVHLEDYNNAKACFKQAFGLNNRFYEALEKLKHLHCFLEEFSEAFAVLKSMSALRPKDEHLAQLLWSCEDIRNRLSMDSIEFRENICHLNNDKERLGKIIKDINPSILESLGVSGLTFFSAHNDIINEESLLLLGLYQEYANRYNGYPDAHHALGQVFFRVGEFDLAEASFLRALELNPDYIQARIKLFKVYMRQGRWDNALEQGEKLNLFNLPYPDIYTDMCEAYLAVEKPGLAKKNLEKAIKIKPDYEKAKNLLLNIR